jgi:hypothetical protein
MFSSLAALAAIAGVAVLPPDRAIAQDAATGHCSFVLKNQWVGPLKACMDPATPAQCTELGGKDENSAAAHAAGSCPVESRVGSCVKPDSALHYYEGDASGLEIGCGFQGGQWNAGG